MKRIKSEAADRDVWEYIEVSPERRAF